MSAGRFGQPPTKWGMEDNQNFGLMSFIRSAEDKPLNLEI